MSDVKEWAPLAGALGLGGLIAETLRRLFNRRKDNADAARAEAESSPEALLYERTLRGLRTLIEAQAHRIAELVKSSRDMNEEIGRMAREIEDLRAHIDTLTGELTKRNLPVPPRRRRKAETPAATPET